MGFPGRRVSILGLGQSGFQSAIVLFEKRFSVFVSDVGFSESVRLNEDKLRERGIEVEIGRHTKERILQSDWVLISPGIAPDSPIWTDLRKAQIPILSEIEVASRFCIASNIVAVTGTAGKTTVSTLIARILNQSGKRAILCGNVGNPWMGEVSKIRADDYVVLEVSSFQLSCCFQFHPHVGILLNIGPNHLDWHPTMEDYVHSKLRLFQNQVGNDFAIFREIDHKTFSPNYHFKSQALHFGKSSTMDPNEEVVKLVIGLFGCSTEKADEVIKDFQGIEHRLEWVTEHQGVRYINDSKCTTTKSLIWALEKMRDRSVILVAGGKPKSSDFGELHHLVKQKVKMAILIGEARPQLIQAWRGACPILEAHNLEESVELSSQRAERGDTVLLSPACSSFDMFRSYEERGDLFKKLILEKVGSLRGHV